MQERAMSTKERIKHLISCLRTRQKQFYLASLDRELHKPLDRARYEGIFTGTRWAIEDLEKALKARYPRPVRRIKPDEREPMKGDTYETCLVCNGPTGASNRLCSSACERRARDGTQKSRASRPDGTRARKGTQISGLEGDGTRKGGPEYRWRYDTYAKRYRKVREW